MFKNLLILYFYIQQKYFRNFKSREKLEKWQNKKIISFLRKIVRKSPYYGAKYCNYDFKEWNKLPIITKEDMMNNFTDLNTVHISKEAAFNVAIKAEKDRDFSPTINGITVGLSSGTSGNRGLFLVSPFERYKWAGIILAKVLPATILKKQKIAFFLRCDSNLYQSVKSNKIIFKYFDLLRPIEEHVKLLNEFQPDLLVAPPSVLRLLVAQSDLHIMPEKIVAVAEVLDDLDKEVLEEYFKQKIHQIYQATEGFLAYTCPHGTLHLNEELLIIEKEFIDDKRFIPIITDFNRTTQPIIRYRLNDILTLKNGECPCHSACLALDKIEGRCDDIFYLKSEINDELIPIFPDFISRAVICASENIHDYKVIQSSLQEIEIYIDQITDFDKVKNSFNQLFEKKGCTKPRIKLLEHIDRDIYRKKKRIESRINASQYNSIRQKQY